MSICAEMSLLVVFSAIVTSYPSLLSDLMPFYRVIFFNWASPENFSRLAPPKFAWSGPPPKFPKCLNHIHFARHLDLFQS